LTQDRVRALIAAGFFIWFGSPIPAPGVAADTVVIKVRALPPSDVPRSLETCISVAQLRRFAV
jgi:hypothetical protein